MSTYFGYQIINEETTMYENQKCNSNTRNQGIQVDKKQPNDVSLACEDLERAISELDYVLITLQDKLAFITSNEPCDRPDKNPPVPSLCNLGGVIRGQADRIDVMADRIRQHSQALQL